MGKDDKKKEPAKKTPADPIEAQLAMLNDPAAMARFFGASVQMPPTIGANEAYFTRMAPELPPGFTPWRAGQEAEPGTWDRNDKARLQAMLNAAGLYGGNPYRAGDWTGADADALRVVLEFANYEGIGKDNGGINLAVRRYAQAATTESVAGQKAPRQPLVAAFANPEAVRQVVRKASMDLMGQRLSDDDEARLVAGFQNQDRAGAARQAAAGGVETGDVAGYTAPLTASQYAESELENRPEAGRQRYLEAFDAIHKSMTGTITEGPTLGEDGGVR